MGIQRIFVSILLWNLADGQSILMSSAPTALEVGEDLNLECVFTPAAGQSVTFFKWKYTGTTSELTLNPMCAVAFGGSTISVAYTKTCTVASNTFTLSLSKASVETINREWCCNVGVSAGSAPGDPGACTTVTLDCGSLAHPSGGTVSTPTTTKDSEATYKCNHGYTMGGSNTRTCQEDGTWSGTAPTCTADTTPPPVPCLCFCEDWCIILVVIVTIYGTSWIFASVVVYVIDKEDQNRLPWELSDGHLKKSQIWVVLFICVPYGPSCVTIYWFKTKRPVFRCVAAPGADVSINCKYTVSSSGEVTVQVKNEAGTILVSVKFIDGKVAGKPNINSRIEFTRNDTTGDVSFKLNNIQTSDSGLYTLSGNDVPCSCVELYVTDKPTSGTEMNKFGTP